MRSKNPFPVVGRSLTVGLLFCVFLDAVDSVFWPTVEVCSTTDSGAVGSGVGETVGVAIYGSGVWLLFDYMTGYGDEAADDAVVDPGLVYWF